MQHKGHNFGYYALLLYLGMFLHRLCAQRTICPPNVLCNPLATAKMVLRNK